ncbi:hypothetical protein Ciccas_012897 [Cichlidogyrus casuarinus]|uniref:EF-hand domain-containing protein n=1 Tax=Cichlidogyrus casuarinus TaxID=1844966 RepID=A0ABD2PM10_9PLAT
MTYVFQAILNEVNVTDGKIAEEDFVNVFVSRVQKRSIADAENLAKQEKVDLSELISTIFHKFDKNGDGKISKCELKEYLKAAHLEKSGISLFFFFREIDTNKDGYLDYKEFSRMMKNMFLIPEELEHR